MSDDTTTRIEKLEAQMASLFDVLFNAAAPLNVHSVSMKAEGGESQGWNVSITPYGIRVERFLPGVNTDETRRVDINADYVDLSRGDARKDKPCTTLCLQADTELVPAPCKSEPEPPTFIRYLSAKQDNMAYWDGPGKEENDILAVSPWEPQGANLGGSGWSQGGKRQLNT